MSYHDVESNLLQQIHVILTEICSVHNYRPQTKFAKVMFSQVSVCPRGGVGLWSQGGGVGCLPHPPGQTPPWADTPLGKHPPGRHPPAQWMLGYGQQAGGMHPTGTHSCYVFANSLIKSFGTLNWRETPECLIVQNNVVRNNS